MRRTRLRLVIVLVLTAMVGLSAFQRSPARRPWPPGLQQVGNQSPPLPPDEALKTFFMPPGYQLELVASEPLIQEPVAIDFDTRGRLWVVEMPGWMPNIGAAGEHDSIGRVVVLEDENGDGRMDKRTVFADRLVLARSLKVLDRGVLVGEPPNAWLMRDTDGDLRMDSRELVTDRYGRREIDPQNNANGFDWGLDNRMYTAGQADIHLRMNDGAFEVQDTLRRGEWGVTHDDAGRVYRNTNESALHVDLVPTHYFARNPHVLRTRGSYERLADANPDLNVVWPVRPNPGTNRAYQAGIDRPDGTLARFTSVCAPLVYRGDRLPPDLYGNVFVAEPAANLVSRIVLDNDGGTIRARKAYERGEFLASTDERFRPVYLANAPDGTLYIADLYRGIIEHKISITMYLRDHILSRNLETPTGYGRIYRVVHERTVRDTSTALSTATPAELVALLSHPSGWWRDTAQRLLVERGFDAAVRAVVPALRKLAEGATEWRVRLHALWTLDGIDAIEPSLVTRALEDAAPEIRVAAVRVAERWLGEADHPLHSAVLARLQDGDRSVRRQLAASVGVLPDGARERAVASVLERDGDDPVAMDAALSSAAGVEPTIIERLLTADSGNPQRTAALTMLAATVVRRADEQAVRQIFAIAGVTGRPHWQRSALMAGAEVALLGATMPGSVTPARASTAPANAPCPTCPGGRAGPGGAYAFPRPPGWPPNAGGRGGGPALRLGREPDALLALASAGSDLSARAERVLTRMTWPGKPGEPAPVAPLSAEEQRRFEAGREVYRNVCQACHQPDGRGQEKLAPGLVGSTLLQARPDIAARILLNGKEGTIGLMPPIGSAFTDEQVAGVLTYVRREWGQSGSAVDPALIAEVRASTARRTRPWTESELLELMRASR